MTTLKMLDDWLNNQDKKTSTYAPAQATNNPSQSTALQTCLQKITTAVARYHRAGSSFQGRSEAFWIFAAGSWTREQYDGEVVEAKKKLPKAKSVDEDLVTAKRLVVEGIEGLRKAEMMDAKDLEEALRVFEKEDGRW